MQGILIGKCLILNKSHATCTCSIGLCYQTSTQAVFPGLLRLSLEAEELWSLGIFLSYFLIGNSELIFQQILHVFCKSKSFYYVIFGIFMDTVCLPVLITRGGMAIEYVVTLLPFVAEWRSYCFDVNNTSINVYQFYWCQLWPSLGIQVIILIFVLWFVLRLWCALTFDSHSSCRPVFLLKISEMLPFWFIIFSVKMRKIYWFLSFFKSIPYWNNLCSLT